MKPFLFFFGGCEFEYIILELKSVPQKYLDFDYFYSFEHRAKEQQQIKPCSERFSPPHSDIEKARVFSA
jgi:hypothetical protein